MIRQRGVLFLMLWFLLGSLSAQTQELPSEQDSAVRFETRLEQTAVWIGDLLEYEITLYPSDGAEIITDNLRAEDLNLEPFRPLEVKLEGDPAGSRFQIILQLTILDAPVGEVAIPSITIYYATRGPAPLGKGFEIETHSMVIPEQKVGLRTTLTSNSLDTRNEVRLQGPSSSLRFLEPFGWLLLVGLLLWGSWQIVSSLRSPSGKKVRVNRQALAKDVRLALSRLEGDRDNGDLPERCGQLSEILKEAVGRLLDFDTSGLTPEELQAEMAARNVSQPVAEQVFEVLDECQSIRYASSDSLDERQNFNTLVGTSREAITQLTRS